MSPALTASTQPGPSVGPLPESFANMSTQGQKYPDHINPNHGVAPGTVFSPLTSPALRPQGHSQSQYPPAPYNANVTSPPKTQGNNGSGKIRGASKNGPKTRPSPIIRPTIDTEGFNSKQSNGSSSKHVNRTSSTNTSTAKRAGQQSQSAVPSPVSTSGFSSFSQPYRQLSNSVPASPAFQPTNSNASTSMNGNAKPFSNHNMSRLQENIAQTAVQNSPSPHQFDLSGVLPAFMNMPQALNPSRNASGSVQQQQTPSTQFFGNNSHQTSNPPLGSLDELMALQSPLDLNNLLSMLGQNNSAIHNSAEQQNNAFSPNGFTFPTGALQPGLPSQTGLSPFDTLLLGNYQQQQQARQQQSQQQPNPGQQGSIAGRAFTAPSNALPAMQSQTSAPLTPASFMNLPANQYSVLSGLLADHQHPTPQLNESNKGETRPHAGEDTYNRPRTGSKQRDGQPIQQTIPSTAHYNYDATMQTGESTEQNRVFPSATSEEMHSTIALNATSPVSPALLAQNIKQVAAAAIAAKDAKSRSKAKGPSRRRASNAASGQGVDGQGDETNESKKYAKKEAPNNGDDLSSPDKPFNLDDGPSLAPSMHGGSRPVSTETSPMLAAQPDSRKSSHKVAEQRRRDSLKLCFEELRFILPPINPDEDEDFYSGPGSRRPGENNVGGQRGKNYTVDPQHPNKGISKVAMLRKSNECKLSIY